MISSSSVYYTKAIMQRKAFWVAAYVLIFFWGGTVLTCLSHNPTCIKTVASLVQPQAIFYVISWNPQGNEFQWNSSRFNSKAGNISVYTHYIYPLYILSLQTLERSGLLFLNELHFYHFDLSELNLKMRLTWVDRRDLKESAPLRFHRVKLWPSHINEDFYER